jgi:hypothetical protein
MVEQRGPDECWPWTCTRDSYGYGVLKSSGKMLKAHRVAYARAHGAVPPSLCVCHRCDNPSCVNPNHLWAGTNLDNIRDRSGKHRTHRPLGQTHPMVKLTENQVREILDSTETHTKVAARFGITFQTVSRIRRKELWKHLHSNP